jgi:hypothetical protein
MMKDSINNLRAVLPREMLSEKRFVRYFLQPKADGGSAKIPLGNHSDPATWLTFEECASQLEHEQGIGYNFLGGEIHGLDIDHCRNPITGVVCPEAQKLLERFPSWAEYSVSGQGIHLLFKGEVRGKQLTETCLQYWNPANSPRFFALTGNMVGDAFTKLKDIGTEFNFIFSQAKWFSAKIREELRDVDPKQWAVLPAERVLVEQPREKTKTKTRKLHKDFNIEDFLKFYGFVVANVTNNEIGKCYRITTCPIKGETHVGQNATSTNFILSKDGGLAFHCHSTGCVEYSVSQVIEHLTKEHGKYPKPIYQSSGNEPVVYTGKLIALSDFTETPATFLWPGFLRDNQLHHFGGRSGQGKSPVTRDLIARVTKGADWPDGAKNIHGPRSVILLAGEDAIETTVLPELRRYGADMSKVFQFIMTTDNGDERLVALDSDLRMLKTEAEQLTDLALVVIDPITNYLGSKNMNKEQEVRDVLMPIAQWSEASNLCTITVGHFNKRGSDAQYLELCMGAAGFVGVARQVFLFGNDPDDADKYTHIITEGRNKQATLKFKTTKVKDELQPNGVLQVEWLGTVERDPDEVVNPQKQREKDNNKDAQDFFRRLLEQGNAYSLSEIEGFMKNEGIECASPKRHLNKIGAKTKQVGKIKKWYLDAFDQLKLEQQEVTND